MVSEINRRSNDIRVPGLILSGTPYSTIPNQNWALGVGYRPNSGRCQQGCYAGKGGLLNLFEVARLRGAVKRRCLRAANAEIGEPSLALNRIDRASAAGARPGRDAQR